MKNLLNIIFILVLVSCAQESKKESKKEVEIPWINANDKKSCEVVIQKDWVGKKMGEFIKVFGQGNINSDFSKQYEYFSIARVPNPDLEGKYLYYDIEIYVNPDTRIITGGMANYDRGPKPEFRELNNGLK